MMVIDHFKTHLDFPFERYFESANQFAAAMEYWMAVLRASDGFDPDLWAPRDRPVEVKEDMYLGKMVDIVSTTLKKEINIQTWSVPGDANMLLAENSGLSPEEYQKQRDAFGPEFELSEEVLNGMSAAEAMAEAREEAARVSSKIWVETALHWQADPKHAEGGFEVAFERLVITSQVTPEGEASVLRALSLFFRPGPVGSEINAVFADDEA